MKNKYNFKHNRSKLLNIAFFCFFGFSGFVYGQSLDSIRVMQYNLLQYGNTTNYCNTECKDTQLGTIVRFVQPDVIGVNELGNSSVFADRILTRVLKPISNSWSAAAFQTLVTSPVNNMLFYNSEKLAFKSQNPIPAEVRNLNEYVLYYKDTDLANRQDTVFLRFIVMHLKAGSADLDVQDRNKMVLSLQRYLKDAPKYANTFFMGDFNVKGASEPCYQSLITYNDTLLRAYDPINRPGEWNNNPAFADIVTQSPRENGEADGGSGGGLDDRFDFILVSSAIMNGYQGVKYVTGSYKAVGNSGNCFNKAIVNCNTTDPRDVVNALYRMSDHLPVAANFTVRRWGTNARTQANLLTHVLLYPNPNQSGIVRLSIPSTESIESLTLFNTIGQAVMTVPNPQQTHVAETYTELDIMALPAGIYSIQVVTASGKTGVARLVKQ